MQIAARITARDTVARAGYTIQPLYIQRPDRPGRVMQVSKWGNSLAIRIPASVVEALGLKEGDDVEIFVEGEKSLSIGRAPDARELLKRVRSLRGKLPKGFRFDRVEANERPKGSKR